jgi:undecaprenyl diphosphate synthase
MPRFDPQKLPVHLAVIMDGNGRWARQRMLPRIVGHQRGVETVRTIVEECSTLGIRYLTLFAFSAENWLRPQNEVGALMSLLRKYIDLEMARMLQNNIRLNVIGNRSDLPPDVEESLRSAMERTSSNTGMTLTLALSYGSRQEITMAARKLAADIASGAVDPAAVDEETFSSYLYTADMPYPDLLIRTSGEMRISNFLLWQIAYAELYFTETNWPDFSVKELHRALRHYQARERRFGMTSDQLQERR